MLKLLKVEPSVAPRYGVPTELVEVPQTRIARSEEEMVPALPEPDQVAIRW